VNGNSLYSDLSKKEHRCCFVVAGFSAAAAAAAAAIIMWKVWKHVRVHTIHLIWGWKILGKV